MEKLFYKLIKVLIRLLITLLISDTLLCAPISSDELCSVNLVPNQLTAKRFEESVITIKCEANVNSGLVAESFEFINPVFDLSFGGAPRTGVFILRGNTTCDQPRVKCWSEYRIAANSIGHLIQHSGNIVYSCQVADQLRNSTNKAQARCQSTGSLKFSNTLKYGEPCFNGNTDQECDQELECSATETENEFESQKQCICRNGLVSIPISYKNTICVEEVPLGSICNYTKQCSAIDSNSICDYNQNGVKVCQCSPDSDEVTEYQTDYIKKCQIKPKTTTTSSTTTTSTTPSADNDDEEESKEVKTILTDNEDKNVNKSANLVDENGFKISSNKKERAGNVGIILFFIAIFLAIIIVIIIIRARNRSDKMVINKKRTAQQQTDDNDGELNEPILNTNQSSGGVDEVDDNTVDEGVKGSGDQQIHNNINESQKIQTNV